MSRKACIFLLSLYLRVDSVVVYVFGQKRCQSARNCAQYVANVCLNGPAEPLFIGLNVEISTNNLAFRLNIGP